MKIPDAALVRAWEASATPNAFLVAIGLPDATGADWQRLRSRASYLRRLGVPLKRFATGPAPVDVDGLKSLVRQARAGKA